MNDPTLSLTEDKSTLVNSFIFELILSNSLIEKVFRKGFSGHKILFIGNTP